MMVTLPDAESIRAQDLAFDVPVLPVERLHEALGFEAPVSPSAISRDTGWSDWKMEAHDAPILRYLYRHFRPARHLEFGTWQGFGALCVLEECDATVWTLNLWEGERSRDAPVYSRKEKSKLPRKFPFLKRKSHSVEIPTDARGEIGRLYLEAGLGHRVCQVFCDSREWDISNYPAGFFDSCLVDGGHSAEVVASDTRRALTLVREGGLVLWHDFCPLREALEHLEAPRGVVKAIENDWHWLGSQTKQLCWLYPSQILMGVRAGGA